MLIEFSVANFRSFRERQTFSMVAAPRLKKKDNTFKVEAYGETLPPLLKTAVIYGPNASGKSNLMLALATITKLVTFDSKDLDAPLPVSPFRFDPRCAETPSEFEVDFVADGHRYRFVVRATSKRIMYESLSVAGGGEDRLLYSRTHNGDTETYFAGDHLGVSFTTFETWKELTPSNALFLSKAAANSKDEFFQVRSPYRWLSLSPYMIFGGLGEFASRSQNLVAKHPTNSRALADFLRRFDIPVSEIRAVKPELAGIGEFESQVRARTYLTHETALGSAEFSFDEESEGTKNLIGFWLPWSVRGGDLFPVMAFDELDSSLHPKIVEALVKNHQSSPSPGQLIFTTHDTHLMDSKVLRRDQIWLTERDRFGATQLRSIYEFEGREGEDIEKRYYEGRYRGLPLVRD
jgi:energy-coupling factor transporter ATP-binding protein EcfA2